MASDVQLWALTTLLLLAIPGHNGQDFDSLVNDGLVKYACVGGTATFDWTVPLQPGEEIEAIQWLHKGLLANQLMAMSHGSKFFRMPAFWTRVTFVDNAGIALSGARLDDTGVYMVEITGHNSTGGTFTLNHTAALQVSENGLTSKRLEVSQQPRAVYNNDTDQWSVDLACGVFDYHNNPPFDVEWLTPSGAVKKSSYYQNGHFHLLVDNPVEGGKYVCRIPLLANACLRSNSRWAREANATVDEIRSRLMVLEAQQTALVAENRLLRNQNAQGVHSQPRLSPLTALALQTLQDQVSGLSTDLTTTSNDLQVSLTAIRNEMNSSLTKQEAINVNIAGRIAALANDLSLAVDASREKDAQLEAQLTSMTNGLATSRPVVIVGLISRVNDLQNLINTYNSQCSENFNRVTNQLNDRTNALQALVNTLTDQVSDLMDQIGNSPQITAQSRLASMNEVSFQAKFPTTATAITTTTTTNGTVHHLSSGSTLVLPTVLNNHGHAYDAISGRFTAPVSGTYFLLASTQSSPGAGSADLRLVLNGVTVQEVSMGAPGQSGSVHVVVHLRQGQRVWLESGGNSDYLSQATAFGGFLVGRD